MRLGRPRAALLLLAFAAALVALPALGPALADMVVRLKDGKVYTIPVEPEDIESIEFGRPAPQAAVEAEKNTAARRADEGQQAGTAEQQANNKAKKKKALGPQVWLVGPDHPLKMPSEAAKRVKSGDTVLIQPGVYERDVAIWPAFVHDLTIRGDGGIAHMKSEGKNADGKGIWIIRGNNVTVENIEFSGTRVRDRNGAGIRISGKSLTIRNCIFHHNEIGILGGEDGGEYVIENSEFYANGFPYTEEFKPGHNIYINRGALLVVRNSYFHDSIVGHQIKSRVKKSVIVNNRITDENGDGSYLIDLPYAGDAFIIGNVLEKGPNTENFILISYAAEKRRVDGRRVYIVNNTAVANRPDAIFVRNAAKDATVMLYNNLLVGIDRVSEGAAEEHGTVEARREDLVDADAFDFRLRAGAAAIDAGVDLPRVEDVPLAPEAQYVHPRASQPRPKVGRLDVGAYEFGG